MNSKWGVSNPYHDEQLFNRNLCLHYFYPLIRIETNKKTLDDSLENLDFGTLSIVVFQTIVNHMGTGTGASEEAIEDAIRHATLKMCPMATPIQLLKVIEKTRHALSNAAEGYCHFKERVFDFKSERFKNVNFHFIEKVETEYGDSCYALTNHGLSILLDSLNVPLENRQIGEELLLEESLRTGAIDQALIAAEQAKVLSMQYHRELTNKKDYLRLHYYNFSWKQDVLPQLEKAHDHVHRCINLEQRILATLSEKMGVSSSDDFRHMESIVKECLERHIRLSNILTNFHEEYIRQQELHGFLPRPVTHIPDPYEDLLIPLLSAHREIGTLLRDPLCRLFSGPNIPGCFDLNSGLTELFRPLYQVEDQPLADIPDKTMEIIELYEPQFTEEVIEQAKRILKEYIHHHDGFFLSDLLKSLEDRYSKLIQMAVIFVLRK